MARGLAAVAALALVTAASGTARAAVCPERWEAANGPLPGGTGPADFGAVPEACGATELALRARAALLVASTKPDFYGSIIAGGMLRARRPVGTRGWLSLALDTVALRYVNNGGLAGTAVSFGPPTIAYYRTVIDTEAATGAAYTRALLPLDTARQSGVETGLEIGGTARTRLRPRVVADGGVALAAPLDLVGGRAYARLDLVALAEGWYAPRPPVGVAVGLATRLQLAPTPTFLTAAPRLTARFALRHGFWLAALVELPVTGADRTDLVASLFAGYSR